MKRALRLAAVLVTTLGILIPTVILVRQAQAENPCFPSESGPGGESCPSCPNFGGYYCSLPLAGPDWYPGICGFGPTCTQRDTDCGTKQSCTDDEVQGFCGESIIYCSTSS